MRKLNISDVIKKSEEIKKRAPDLYEMYCSQETREAFPDAFRQIERANVGPRGPALIQIDLSLYHVKAAK